ncbi:MAG: FUSC family protein [Geminicoccaceae bacterium]
MAALTWREALFSAKTFAAAMLAVWIALRLDLPQPIWAMLTVYIVSQPLAGMVLSKAVFRVLGTCAGAVMAVLLVALFADTRELFLLALAGWLGFCSFAALYLRDVPAAYGALLAGYTAAIIGVPAALAPETAFDSAWSRCLEITLGIGCATLVSRVVFPRTAGQALAATLEASLAAAAQWTGDVLRGEAEGGQGLADRRKLVADAVMLEQLRAHAVFDTPEVRALERPVRLVQARLLSLLAVLVAIQDRRAGLRRADPSREAALGPLLLEVAEAAARPVHPEGADAELTRRIDAAMPDLAEQAAERAAILQQGILLRLHDVLALWRALRHPERCQGDQVAPFTRYRDPLLAALGGLGVFLAVLTASAFWIATAWAHGAQAVIFAGVVASIMAGLDDPATAATRFFQMNLIGTGIAAIYVFALFPTITGFASLVAVLLPVYLPFGMLLGLPQLGPTVLPLLLGVTAVLGIGQSTTPDFAAFVDTALGLCAGIAIAILQFRLLRPFGVGWTVRRLVHGLLADLADQATAQQLAAREAFESRMFDRINALFVRLDPDDPGQRDVMQAALASLRIGLNLRLLRRVQPELPQDAGRAVAAACAALGAQLAALAARDAAPVSSLPALGAATEALLAAGPVPHVAAALASVGGIETSLVRHAAFFALPEPAADAAAAVPVPA